MIIDIQINDLIKNEIDKCLDLYNNYMALYELFNDEYYKNIALSMFIRIEGFRVGLL